MLEKVGGSGITIHGFSAFSCPELVTIAGSLSADAASKLTSFDMPKLKSLSGVNLVRLTAFSDFLCLRLLSGIIRLLNQIGL